VAEPFELVDPATVIGWRRESEFQASVTALADDLNWWWRHERKSRQAKPGWPDLVFMREPQIFYAELKMPGKKLTLDQEFVIDLLRRCGQTVYVWRPENWDEIGEVLR